MPLPKPIAFDASAPRAVADLYQQHYQSQRNAGKEHTDAHRYASRMIKHAGWHKTSRGWRQLGPDLRDKINVREAVKQPDGRYLIEDVDVFYPNAVKGKEMAYGPKDVEEFIEATNRGINSGGQKPGLIEGHPNELQAALGTQLDSRGFGVNWRESPRGKAWARCDLTDVDEPTVRRMKDLRLPGLSAGIVKDAGGLNRRFGHIALLGGTSAALSHLPVTEIYSVGGQVCFSADYHTFSSKGKTTMFGPKLKEAHSAYAAAFSAYEAAEASQCAGEPGSVEKLREAGNKLAEAFKGIRSEMGEDKEDGSGEAFEAGSDLPLATTPASPESTPPMPGVGNETGSFAAGATMDFVADPAGAFNALSAKFSASESEKAKLLTTVRALTKVAEGLAGRQLRSDFSADIDKLKRNGHILPSDAEIEAQFSAIAASPDPKAGISRLVKMLSSLPKKPSPAAAGQVFGAADEQPNVAAQESTFSVGEAELDASLARVRNILGAGTYSEHEIALGRSVVSSNGR